MWSHNPPKIANLPWRAARAHSRTFADIQIVIWIIPSSQIFFLVSNFFSMFGHAFFLISAHRVKKCKKMRARILMRKTLAICGKGNSTTRLTLRVHTDVDSDVCKCRCRMSTEFPANVDGNVENISIYHGKKAQKNQNFMLEKCRIICRYIYIYIYIYIHTHTHTHKKAQFWSIFTIKSAKIRD